MPVKVEAREANQAVVEEVIEEADLSSMAEPGDAETTIAQYPFIEDNEQAQRNLKELRKLLEEVRQGHEFRSEYTAGEAAFLDLAAYFDRWVEELQAKPGPEEKMIDLLDRIKQRKQGDSEWANDYRKYNSLFEARMTHGVYHSLTGGWTPEGGPDHRFVIQASQIFAGERERFFPELTISQPAEQAPPLRRVA